MSDPQTSELAAALDRDQRTQRRARSIRREYLTIVWFEWGYRIVLGGLGLLNLWLGFTNRDPIGVFAFALVLVALWLTRNTVTKAKLRRDDQLATLLFDVLYESTLEEQA